MLVYFGFPNKDIPWGGWHVTVCGRTNLSTKDMINAVRRAIKAADLEMDDSTIVDWCNERDCLIERGFIWIKNARIMRFENCLREILNETHGIRMKKPFNADGYFHISLAESSPAAVLAKGPLRLFVVYLAEDGSTTWHPVRTRRVSQSIGGPVVPLAIPYPNLNPNPARHAVLHSKTLVYFGFPNKDIPWGGWHVTVCGRTNLSTGDMTNAVRHAIKAADLKMDDSTIVDWCNEIDCFVEGGFIWIKNARMMRFENCLREILKVSYGINMKKQFNSDGYFHIFLAGSSPDTVLAKGPLRLFVVTLAEDGSIAWCPMSSGAHSGWSNISPVPLAIPYPYPNPNPYPYPYPMPNAIQNNPERKKKHRLLSNKPDECKVS